MDSDMDIAKDYEDDKKRKRSEMSVSEADSSLLLESKQGQKLDESKGEDNGLDAQKQKKTVAVKSKAQRRKA